MKSYILFLLILGCSILRGQSDRILYYNINTGGAAITDRSINTLSGYNLARGWTSVVDLGSNRILYYNSNTGAAAITDYSINTLRGYNLSGGWTNVVNLGSNQILYYNSNTGAAAITDYALNTLRGFNLSRGWTSVENIGVNRIVFYNSTSGLAAITDNSFNRDLSNHNLSIGWTIVKSIDDNRVVFYNSASGLTVITDNNLRDLSRYNLAGGWTNIVNLGSNRILYSNRNSGAAAITDYSMNTLGGYNLAGGWSNVIALQPSILNVQPNIPITLNLATVYSDADFKGAVVGIKNLGRKTMSELGLVGGTGSIKVAWGYKAIIYYNNGTQSMEVVGDRETLPSQAVGLPPKTRRTSSVTAIEIVAYTPLSGWVDMHTHPMSHLGWGGKLFHGAPDVGILVPAKDNCQQYQRANNINEALCSCKGTHGGVGLFDNTCGDDLRKGLLRIMEGTLSKGSVESGGPPVQTAHHEEGARGFPNFQGWPAYNDLTHQQMWIDWVKRTYEGGLRVMVALTVNNATYSASFSGPGDRNPDDVSSSNIQIDEMIRLVSRNNTWMEIARTPQDLRRIVSASKLAIILGIEVDNIGNFNKNPNVNANAPTEESRRLVVEEINRLYNQGIRYIFPVHVVDNKFGGSAIYEDAFNFSNYHQTGNFFDIICGEARDSITKSYKNFESFVGLAGLKIGVDIARRPSPLPNCDNGTGHKNRLGLTPLGEFAIREMIKKGMIIDLDHMSDRAIERTLWLGEQFNYPINSGHSGIRSGEKASERSIKISQYQRISKLGGIAGMGTDATTADNFKDGFNQLIKVMDYKGVAIGTDANGFAKLPKPPGYIGITYDASFPMCRTGNRSWDYNNEGVAHYGLMADFLRDVKGINNDGAKAVEHLNRSAEHFAQMWEKCERQKVNIR